MGLTIRVFFSLYAYSLFAVRGNPGVMLPKGSRAGHSASEGVEIACSPTELHMTGIVLDPKNYGLESSGTRFFFFGLALYGSRKPLI